MAWNNKDRKVKGTAVRSAVRGYEVFVNLDEPYVDLKHGKVSSIGYPTIDDAIGELGAATVKRIRAGESVSVAVTVQESVWEE